MSTTARFTGAKGKDNTSRLEFNDFQTLTTSASIACLVKPNAKYTLFSLAVATATPAITINVGTSTTAPFVGDVVEFQIAADGTTRVITFSTGFLPSGTLSVTASKTITIAFMFNGTAWQERNRGIITA